MHVSFSPLSYHLSSFAVKRAGAAPRRKKALLPPSTIINEKDAKKFQGKSRILENCGGTPANIDIYQLRAFGLPRPLRRFAFFNGCSGWVSIFRGCLRQVRRPAFRHEEIGRKPPPATNRDFSRHFSSATEQFHMRSSTNCAKW